MHVYAQLPPQVLAAFPTTEGSGLSSREGISDKLTPWRLPIVRREWGHKSNTQQSNTRSYFLQWYNVIDITELYDYPRVL
jgi:hypothetical protein